MAVQFTQRTTSEGPLDVVHGQGDVDTLDLSVANEPVDNKPLDDTAEDLEHARNPLGYTVTEPTEAEMEGRDSLKGSTHHSDLDVDADETDLDIESEVEK